MIVERWRQSTPVEFWKEFSLPNGGQMTFTAIGQKLRQQRLDEDKALSERAKLEYGDTFSSFFTYRKGSQNLVMTDPTFIAKRYRSLHGTA